VHACTDITGFGLIGHASEMAAASNCTLEIDAPRVPLLEGARELVRGNIPGGGRTNVQHFGAGVTVGDGVDFEVVQLLHDPQTSGGLLASVAPGHLAAALSALRTAGVPAEVIGRVLLPSAHRVSII
jgi:selenide,water dikinase